MGRNNLLVMIVFLITSCGNANDAPVPAASAQAAQAQAGSWQRLKDEAAKRMDAYANSGKPRIVPRGSKPEIIVKGEQLLIEGKRVAIGQPLETWKQAIPGAPRCNGAHLSSCDWDNLGITVLAEDGVVKQLDVYFNLGPWRHFAEQAPDGTPIPPTPDPRPKHPYPGYFEWDGYGIDANTRFWEIRASVDPGRNVRCDLLTNNCGNTTAHFSDHAKIYLSLYQTTHENGRLETFSIAR